MHSHSQSDSRAISACSETDVFIAGAGPAGLAGAIALARNGMRVHVADGMAPPIDKACGEGLMPDTLAALEGLGIDLNAAGGDVSARIRGIRFLDTDSGSVAEARFPARDGRGMKRQALYLLLLDRAVELGVRFSWETVVQGFTATDAATGSVVETNRGPIRTKFIVGADGHQSRIRACAGLDRASVTSRRIGLRQHFAAAPWSEFVEVYWSGHGQAYVTPVSSGEVCVAFVAQRKFAGGVPEALSHFPQLAARLAGGEASDAPRGAVTYSRRLHRVTRGDVALLGDASGSVDAVTGEGLSLCFRQALALADAIAANDLAAYQRAHTAMRRMPHLMAATMLTLDRYSLLRTGLIALLARFPAIFEKLLEVHIGHQSQPRRVMAVMVAAESFRVEGIPQVLKPPLISMALLPRLKPWSTWKPSQRRRFGSGIRVRTHVSESRHGHLGVLRPTHRDETAMDGHAVESGVNEPDPRSAESRKRANVPRNAVGCPYRSRSRAGFQAIELGSATYG